MAQLIDFGHLYSGAHRPGEPLTRQGKRALDREVAKRGRQAKAMEVRLLKDRIKRLKAVIKEGTSNG